MDPQGSVGKAMAKTSEEWLKQAEYDLGTARALVEAGRHPYAVFMCHLCLEKALKGLYFNRLGEVPPKTHNLIFLLGKIEIEPSEAMGKFFVRVNESSIATRYPEDIAATEKNFSRGVVEEVLLKSTEALRWIEGQL